MTDEKITEYYQSSEPDLKNEFGTIRGQVSYGILDNLRRSRLWAVIFACLMVLVSTLALTRFWLAHLGIDTLSLPTTNFSQQIVTTVVYLGSLIFSVYFWSIATSFKRVALSADASEVENLILRLRTFWIFASLFLLVVLLLWLVLPFMTIR